MGVVLLVSGAVLFQRGAYVAAHDFFDPVRSRFKSEINMDAFQCLRQPPIGKAS